MKLVKLGLLVIAWLVVFAAIPATADEVTGEDRRLNAVLADYWTYHLRENPIAATQAGLREFNDRMPGVTAADRARRLETAKRFLQISRGFDRARLSSSGRMSAEVFEWVLEDAIAEEELGLSRIPFNTFSGFFMSALMASNGVLMETVQDYEDYISRLKDIPRYFDENLDNMRDGVRTGFVLPQIVIDGVLPTIKAQLKDDVEDSSFYGPFRNMSARIPDDDKQRLRASARRAIGSHVLPAFGALARFFEDEYQASETLGAEQLPDGKRYYAFQVRRYTTLTDTTPDDIHRVGLEEVARIRKEMMSIIDELEFDGDLSDFARFLRNDPQFYATSKEALLKEVAYTAKRIDYKMPGFFHTLPRQSYGVVPVPAEIAPNYTTGAYHSAPLGGSHGGEFWVNTHGLNQRPLYELPALTLHEAVPGHHHQNALALEMKDVPAFRRDLYFSAFGEGWALYSEKLGVEMGIYRTPYEHFGRLSYEMWRACRLVVDTGIHAKGWTRQSAIDFLADNTSLSASNIRAEVDRYISWPGQALSYKLGELKIWELRRAAERRLGDDFDLRSFHDLILSNGALPLASLEEAVRRYMATERGEE